MHWSLEVFLLVTSCLPSTLCACVPDVPETLLHDPAVLRHPAVVAAFEDVGRNLSALVVNTTRDGFSFAIVHASKPELAFSLNHGVLKMNETAENVTSNDVTSDSIFRIASVSKSFAAFSALVAENRGKTLAADLEITLDTHVRSLLPEFMLPGADWNNGGNGITLSMLASHTSGLTREAYITPFNMVTASGKANAETIGAAWASVTPESVIKHFKKTNLMFAPGQGAAYSNAGISLLASAVTAYYNNITQSELTWTQLVSQRIFAPLNMTHSFFGTIPSELIPYIGVPGVPHWADLIVGLGYDPAAGMWSSANDLAKYIHHIWLSPDPRPELITLSQRRRTLKPSIALPDGKQLTGPGWEIDLRRSKTSNRAGGLEKTYALYGKSGDAGGWHAWIDTVPNLGYGVVILSQESGLADYSRIVPTNLRDSVHEILVPAFANVLSERMQDRYGGWYGNARDSGLILEQVRSGNVSNSTTYAKLEVKEDILYLRVLVINGTSALEGLDKLGWTEESGPRYWSTEEGVVLVPSEGSGEKEEFGPGAQIWRWMLPGLETCDWFDFDGYTDYNGWPLSKMVLVEKDEGVELHYPPFDIILGRIEVSNPTTTPPYLHNNLAAVSTHR